MVLTIWLPDFIIERSQEDFDIMAGLEERKVFQKVYNGQCRLLHELNDCWTI
jgi:hypothetical protein